MKNLMKLSILTVMAFSAMATAQETERLIITEVNSPSNSKNSLTVTAQSKEVQFGDSRYVEVPSEQVDVEMRRLSLSGDVVVERDVTIHQLSGTYKSEPQTYPNSVTASAVPVYEVTTGSETPNDPRFSQQTIFADRDTSNPTSSQIHAAWALGEQKITPRVAVLDGGFLNEGRFEDIQPVASYSFVDSGRVPYGSPAWDDAGDLDCESGHGAGVYGVIGATIDNGVGMSGIVDADMYMLQVLKCKSGSLFDAAQALRWAAGGHIDGMPDIEEPVHIVNMSLGSSSSCPTFMQNAIDFAVEQGVKVMIASGNNGYNVENFTPANCANITVVTALDNVTADLTDYANYGDGVNLSAQGEDILSYYYDDDGDGTVAYWGGTSFATPVASGIYALAKAYAPGVSNDTLDFLAEKTSEPMDNFECATKGCGDGLIDAPRFVRAAMQFDQGDFGDVTSALSETAICDKEAYLMSDGLKARLCSAYIINLNPIDYSDESSDNMTYRIVSFPADEAPDSLNTEELITTENTEVLLSNLGDTSSTGYAYQICENGQCEPLFYTLNVDQSSRPASCP